MHHMMQMMQGLIQMNIDNQKLNLENQRNGNHKMASTKLEVKNFANLKSFENDPSKWKEWRRRFLNSVKECDDSFATLIESFEKREAEIDEFAYDPTKSQQSVNLHVRLSNCTTGFSHNILEGVKNNNGGEA